MNKTAAMSKINPQAMSMDESPGGGGDGKARDASYSIALGFVSSCHGASCLAHYSLMSSMEDTVSRSHCAREIRKELELFTDLNLIEAMIEVFVNRDDEGCRAAVPKIQDDIYRLLAEWEGEFLNKLGAVDND
ncbi:MAG: hypothetical protein PF440_01850 [Thiomicrorhabdus sp.]|jgi:hypothetical protein|nr:hypothetical protein [Thiomicrorhabdus sp.]